MIRHKKRKNSDLWYLPYLNVMVVVLIMSVFLLSNIKVYEQSEPQQDAQVSTAQIAGEWVGTMTEDYSADVRYDYRLVISQSQDEISGITYQESTNYSVDIYAESAILGTVTGDDVYFYEDSTLMLDNLSLDYWCRIEVRLSYQEVDGQATLIGTWDSVEGQQVGCDTIEGRVVLTREN